MIRVLICGFCGRMGTQIVNAVATQNDMMVVGGFDPAAPSPDVTLNGEIIAPAFTDLSIALQQSEPDVLVDFTAPNAVEGNLRIALPLGVDCVVGTTGVPLEKYAELVKLAPEGTTLFNAPNFTTGAVLMMAFAKTAARFFPDAEVIEFHHNGKKDAPSGTAISTAREIARVRSEAGISGSAPGKETELSGYEGARGADVSSIPVHSVRSNGYVAHQEVIFGSPGQTLTIRHDSIDRSSYMPGILLAIREVANLSGLIIGLEELLGL